MKRTITAHLKAEVPGGMQAQSLFGLHELTAVVTHHITCKSGEEKVLKSGVHHLHRSNTSTYT